MTAIPARCDICQSSDGLLYDVRDICQPDKRAEGELGLCDKHRDLLATGWASIHPIGVMEPSR
jgi:hypothetical protein